MIRVLHVIKGLNAGGAETLVLLAAANRDRDAFAYDVAHLLSSHTDLVGAIEAEEVPVHDLRGSPDYDPRWVLRLRNLIVSGGFDIVHTHSPLVAAGARVAVRMLPRARRPLLVSTLHNVWESHNVVVRGADRATGSDSLRLTVSEAVRRSFPSRSPGLVVTEIHGVDVDRIRSRSDRDGARSELGMSADEIVIGTVANLKPHKAYDDLLTAAQDVLGRVPRARFVAIGEGPLREELEASRTARGLDGGFRFLGYRPDATRLLSGFDVFCLSSRHEGLPLALMESLVCGVPSVVTRVGGIPELVTDGVEGLLVEPGRPDLLADALVSLSGDASLRAAMSTAAANRGDQLRADLSTARIEAHYRRLLGA